MKPSSCKQKGRRLQQYVRSRLIQHFGFNENDVYSRSMGAGGTDVFLAEAAREKFPVAIECKNTERVNIWAAYEQAASNSEGDIPIVVIKKNRTNPLVVLDFDQFLGLVKV